MKNTVKLEIDWDIIEIMKRFWWYLALFGFTLPTFWSLLKPGIHNIQDSMQYFRIYEMNKCFQDGQIPCRWVPDMGFGFGYPLYIYYSPGPYYLGELFHLLGFQYIDCVKILFIGGFLVSAFGMMLLAMNIFKSESISFIVALLYIYLPVRAVQVYVRGSLGEFLAMAIFPLIFLFSYRLVNSIGKLNSLWLCLVCFGLLITHNLMCVAFLPVLLVWLFYLFWQKRNKQIFVKVVISLLFGVGLASFYVIPLLFERNFVHLETMTGGYFDYRQHFVSIKQLFLDNRWGYGSSVLGDGDDLSLSVGIIQWLLALISVIYLLFIVKKREKSDNLLFIFAVLNLIYLFLIHQRSSFIWSIFTFLKYFQFPWRFLVITGFLMPLMAGYLFKYLNKKRVNVLAIVVACLLIILYGKYFKPQKWLQVNDSYFFTQEEFRKQQTASIFDYLPKSAVLPPNYPAPDIPEVTGGEAIVKYYDKFSNRQVGAIEVISDKAIIRLPIFDFPGMIVHVDNKPVVFNHSDCTEQDYCFGQISFELNQGDHIIEVQLTRTTFRVIGDLLSLISVLLLTIYLYKTR